MLEAIWDPLERSRETGRFCAVEILVEVNKDESGLVTTEKHLRDMTESDWRCLDIYP